MVFVLNLFSSDSLRKLLLSYFLVKYYFLPQKLEPSSTSLLQNQARSMPSPSLPLTPLSAPPRQGLRKPMECLDCGQRGHTKDNCPTPKNLLNFCARCLSTSHPIYECPSIRDVCQICRNNNLGDLAYGHLRYVSENLTFSYYSWIILARCITRWTNPDASTYRGISLHPASKSGLTRRGSTLPHKMPSTPVVKECFEMF